MVEVGVAAALLLIVIGVGVLGPQGLLVAGVATTAGGLFASLVVGLVYHLRLREQLRRLALLEPGWWWAPSRLHGQLDDAGRAAVFPFYRAGVASVAIALGGLFLVGIAAVKAFWLTS